MKYSLFSFLLVTCLTIGNAQNKIKGNKNVISIETPLNNYNSIVVGEDFEVILVKSMSPSILVETDENLHDYINFEVNDSVFSIHSTAKIRSKKRLNVTLKYSDKLERIEVKDSGKLEAVSNISTDTITLIISDFGKVNLDFSSKLFSLQHSGRLKLNAKSNLNILSDVVNLNLSESSKLDAFIKSDSIQVNMTDNSRMEIDGSTRIANFNLTGSSDVLGKTFSSNNCNAILREESDLTIQVTDSIIINSSGISETYLYGNPKITIENFADKSKLHKKEL